MLGRKTLGLIAGAALIGASTYATPAFAADRYKVDPAHATALFWVSHFNWSNTVARFNKVSGDIVFDEQNPEKSSVSVVIETASVDSNHEARDKHLRSPDFFNSAEFPQMKFVSTKISKTGAKTGKITGNLTLLGVTKPVTLDVKFNAKTPHFRVKDRIHAGFSARTQIKRSEWGMKKFLPAIGDDITIILEIEAIKQ